MRESAGAVRVLLVETTRYAPTTPLFGGAEGEGISIELFDESRYEGGTGLGARVLRRVLPWQGERARRAFNRALVEAARRSRPTHLVVVKGALVERESIEEIGKGLGIRTVNFATDDPFNRSACPETVRECVSAYDVYYTTKRANQGDLLAQGARDVRYLPFAYKPEVHFFEEAGSVAEAARFRCDVAFIGGADEDRTPYFRRLARELPEARLHLYGGYWGRDGELRRYARGFANGREYRLAVSGAKVVVNLVRRANRDGHVMRSYEVPAMGGAMVSEWTEEHEEIFGALPAGGYFRTPEEMVEAVRLLLGEEGRRRELAARLRERVAGGGNTYAARLREMIREGSGRRG